MDYSDVSDAECAAQFRLHFIALRSLCVPPLPPSVIPSATVQSNSNLSPAEGQDFRDTFDAVAKRKARLEHQIIDLKDLLGAALAALSEQEDFLEKHKPLLSSYRRLPDYIWQCIFSQVVFGDWEQSHVQKQSHSIFMNAKARLAPLSISGVCTFWRNLCLQEPALWSYLAFEVGEGGLSPSIAGLLAIFLVRSENHSLHISITLRHGGRTGIQAIIPLFREAHRWSFAELRLPAMTLDLNSGLFPIAPTPLLTHLHLTSNECPSTLPTGAILLRESPKLTQVVLTNLALDPISLPNLFSWDSIEDFTVTTSEDPSLPFQGVSERVLDLSFHLAPRLRSWTWKYYEIEPPSRNLFHETLQNIWFGPRDCSSLSSFTFPALQKLTLFNSQEMSDGGSAFQHFLVRSPNITELELVLCMNLNLHGMFPEGVQLAQNLTSITFVWHLPRNSYVLSSTSLASPLFKVNLPNLKTVVIACFACRGDDDGLNCLWMVEFVKDLVMQPRTSLPPTKVGLDCRKEELHEKTYQALTRIRDDSSLFTFNDI
ncbi:hypothetical protein DL96DRAFT_1631383 [Flagelloscypha sp. PMI_526]|nr:hypothetical protein DL96DRAFT_1631383 [Flagelloscypha sp. PMI_526]